MKQKLQNHCSNLNHSYPQNKIKMNLTTHWIQKTRHKLKGIGNEIISPHLKLVFLQKIKLNYKSSIVITYNSYRNLTLKPNLIVNSPFILGEKSIDYFFHS